ncbi:hypothetical protein [Streptomyces sp. NPDC001843]|uniref:hypothetical protein n=1 Tax=Streptomyces sp. NPDC001843 TaxID=3364617 RepID=UPI003692C23E
MKLRPLVNPSVSVRGVVRGIHFADVSAIDQPSGTPLLPARDQDTLLLGEALGPVSRK